MHDFIHSSNPTAVLLHEDLSKLSDRSLRLLAGAVGSAARAAGAASANQLDDDAANRTALITAICSRTGLNDDDEAADDHAEWELVHEPTPLHTPPASPTTALKPLLRPAERLATSVDPAWRAPRWAPIKLVAAAQDAQAARATFYVDRSSEAAATDGWRAPFWEAKAVEGMKQEREDQWRAPRWARSPSPKTRAKKQAEYVDGWRAEAAPFAWSPPSYAVVTNAPSKLRAPGEPAAGGADWSPPAWAKLSFQAAG